MRSGSGWWRSFLVSAISGRCSWAPRAISRSRRTVQTVTVGISFDELCQFRRERVKTEGASARAGLSHRKMNAVRKARDDQCSESVPEPARFCRERWTTIEDSASVPAWDDDAHAEWCEKWAPRCPEHNPQHVRRALGFRERNIGELELRVALGGDLGVCEVVVDERADEVHEDCALWSAQRT